MDEKPPAPLEYHTPPAERPLCLGEHLWNAVAASVAAFLLLASACGVAPHLETIFKDFKTELPGLTQLMLSMSRWAANQFGWVWLLLALIGLVVLGLVIDRQAPTDREIRRYGRWMRRTLFILTLLWLALVTVAGLMPILQLIQSVSGTPK